MDSDNSLVRCIFRTVNEPTIENYIFHILSSQNSLGGNKPNPKNSGSQNDNGEWVWLFYVKKETSFNFKLCICNDGELEIKSEERLESYHEFVVPPLSVDQAISLDLGWNQSYESTIISIDDIINENEELFEKLIEIEIDFDTEETEFKEDENFDVLSTNRFQESLIKVSPRIRIKITTESMDSICGSSSEVEEIMSHQINAKRHMLIPSKTSSSDPVSSSSDRILSDIPKVTELPGEDEVFVDKGNIYDSSFKDLESSNESNVRNLKIFDFGEKDINKRSKINLIKTNTSDIGKAEVAYYPVLIEDLDNETMELTSNTGIYEVEEINDILPEYNDDTITNEFKITYSIKTELNLVETNKMYDEQESTEVLEENKRFSLSLEDKKLISETNDIMKDNKVPADKIKVSKFRNLDQKNRIKIKNKEIYNWKVGEIFSSPCCLLSVDKNEISLQEIKANISFVENNYLRKDEIIVTIIKVHDENDPSTESFKKNYLLNNDSKFGIIEVIAEKLLKDIFFSLNILENDNNIPYKESENNLNENIIPQNVDNSKEKNGTIEISIETCSDDKRNNQTMLHGIREKLFQGIYEDDSFFNVPISRSLDAESNDSSIVTSLSKDSLEYILNDTQNENIMEQKNVCLSSSKENCTEKSDELPQSFLSQAANQMFYNQELVCDNNIFFPVGENIDRLKNKDIHFTNIAFSYPNTNNMSPKKLLPEKFEYQGPDSTSKYLICENQTDNSSRFNPMLCMFINKSANELIRNQMENNKNNMEKKTSTNDKYFSFDTSISSNRDSAVVCDSDSQFGRCTIIQDDSYDEFMRNHPMTTSYTVDSLFISTISSNKQTHIPSQDTLNSEETYILLKDTESNNKNKRPMTYCSLPIPPKRGLKRSPALEGVCDLLNKTDEELELIQHRIYLVNDDDLYPDTLTPTKADSSLRSEGSVYDISYIDDGPYSEDDLSFINYQSKKFLLRVKLAECDECTLSSELDVEKCPHDEIITPVSTIKAKRKKNRLFKIFGCFSKNKT